MNRFRIIAAARNNEELKYAIKSDVEIIFMLSVNINDIKNQADAVHKSGKKFFVHMDLAEGIGKDAYGVKFAKEQGADGIISTRSNIIKMAKKEGLHTVQRLFAVDSQSVDTIIETASSSKPDMIEIMPGVLPKVVKRLKNELDMPLIAGGLIDSYNEIDELLSAGATAISTGKKEFWNK